MSLLNPWFWIACVVILVGTYAGGRLQQHYVDEEDFAVYKAQLKGQRDAMIGLWANGVQQIDDLEKRNEALRLAAFTPSETEAHNLPAAVAGARVGAPAVRVLNRAIAAANSSRPSAAAAGTAAPAAPDPDGTAKEGDPSVERAAPADGGGDSTVGMLTEWGVLASKLYRGCLDRVDEVTRAYDNVRKPTLNQTNG